MVAAPRRSNAASASDLPAPIPPVRPTNGGAGIGTSGGGLVVVGRLGRGGLVGGGGGLVGRRSLFLGDRLGSGLLGLDLGGDVDRLGREVDVRGDAGIFGHALGRGGEDVLGQ